MNQTIGNFRINLYRNVISIFDVSTGSLLKAKEVTNHNNSEAEYNSVCLMVKNKIAKLKAI